MKAALVGHSGFVGENLKKQYDFTDLYNSTNFKDLTDKSYDLIVCSGIPAGMWTANNFPEKDLENIQVLLDVLKTVRVGKFVLISSTAVFKQPVKNIYDDDRKFETDLAYGKHRRYAEKFIEDNFETRLIIRLPALFGNNLKKNFIYDLLNPEPAFIPKYKYDEVLVSLNNDNKKLLNNYYEFDTKKNVYSFDNDKAEKDNKRKQILNVLKKADFTALKFTNSESAYQFYCIDNLWKDINIALENNINVLNICSEPIKAKEAVKEIFSEDFSDDDGKEPFDYDMKTRYATLWGKDKFDDYQYSRQEVLKELKNFFKDILIKN